VTWSHRNLGPLWEAPSDSRWLHAKVAALALRRARAGGREGWSAGGADEDRRRHVPLYGDARRRAPRQAPAKTCTSAMASSSATTRCSSCTRWGRGGAEAPGGRSETKADGKTERRRQSDPYLAERERPRLLRRCRGSKRDRGGGEDWEAPLVGSLPRRTGEASAPPPCSIGVSRGWRFAGRDWSEQRGERNEWMRKRTEK
jgi:hypothetical protein